MKNLHTWYFLCFKYVICFCSFTLLFMNSIYSQTQKEDKLNVLFIAVDDMNDWITPLGGIQGVKTPNLERLAKMSMTFTNAHCASPACAPSRISVMTGVHPAKSGIMRNVWYDGPEWRKQPALKDVVTIEQFFKKQGYETKAGGKIYHSLAPPWMISNQAEPASWDFYFPSVHVPIPYQVRAPDSVIFSIDTVEKRFHQYFTWGPLSQKDEKMADYQIVDWAKYELSQDREKPLFLAVGLFRPHMPWEVPQKYFDMYPIDSIPDLEIKENDLEDAFDHGRRHWHKFVLDHKQWKKVLQAYMASITFADAQLGRLLDALEDSKIKDNTAIVLWADHGMHMGEKENWEKFTLWEESTKVPLFIMAPGITQGGSKSNIPVSLVDVYPTLAELIGQTAPQHCDGESLVPILKNQSTSHKPVVTAYEFKQGPAYSVRTQRYRYIYYPSNGLEELYDHENDHNEFINIAYQPKNQNIVANHRKHVKETVPDLKWNNKLPVGYKLNKDNTISQIGFKTLNR